MIDYNDMKDKIEEIGYYATEELLYDTYNALYMIDEEEKQTGQDIYAICLEGPPGAGKTAFAKTYTEICKKMVDDKTEMISYQCDATTGKSELFEDINVSAAITRDGRKVNIPGKLVEAIKKANEGHRVILFIDEYDKAREETDAFFLQLLQDGKINSTQHGDLEVKDEFKSHLQVIFCKNDMREEVSGPLSRRLRIIRLDLMRPELFFKLANRLLIEEKENKVNDGLLNLVTLMYEEAYNNREIYKRLPACSEMLIALEDADRLLKRANAPKHVIYNSIIKNMFKSLDDIKTFESEVANNNTELYNLINSMKSSKNDEDINKESINSLIARNIYKDTFNKLNAKMDELDKVTREYKERFSKLEEEKRIELENGRLVSHVEEPKFISNFFDEGAYVKRGYDIFKSSDNEWVDIGSINMPDLSRYDLVDKLVKNAFKVGIKVYENGFLLKEKNGLKLIVVNDIDSDGNFKYRLMCNYPIVPSAFFEDIKNFINFMIEVYKRQEKSAKQVSDDALGLSFGSFNINCLVYGKTDDDNNFNIYNLDISKNISDVSYLDKVSDSDYSSVDEVIRLSSNIKKEKVKVKINE